MSMMAADQELDIGAFGEEALRGWTTAAPGPALSRRLSTAAAILRARDEVVDAVCGYTELVVHHRPGADQTRLREALLAAWHQAPSAAATTRRQRIVVRYDGPDLERLAAHCRLSVAACIARHSAPVYTVALLGFRPHFPYLHGLDPVLAMPRRATPRSRVPAGSVAIAGEQAGIYPEESPGGWALIGRCDPGRCRELQVGDEVVFTQARP